MDNPVIFKPVFWRLFVYRFFPFYIGWTGANIVYRINSHLPVTPFFLVIATLSIFLVALITVFLTHKKFEIIVDKNKISGIGAGWGTPIETFPIADFDFSYRGKQSFSEKISFFHTIRSLSGKRIVVVDFIYGRSIADDIYQAAEQNYLQSSKS
jgi:hypothetical protein